MKNLSDSHSITNKQDHAARPSNIRQKTASMFCSEQSMDILAVKNPQALAPIKASKFNFPQKVAAHFLTYKQRLSAMTGTGNT
ncbi:hypothetical protein JCM14076_29080 [Methylosoma difficile]